MPEELLYSVDLWLILAASIFLFLGFTEAGFRLGWRARARVSEDSKSEITTIQAAMLGLLALILGFTFAMAMSRFESRKEVVLDEANAIGTTFSGRNCSRNRRAKRSPTCYVSMSKFDWPSTKQAPTRRS